MRFAGYGLLIGIAVGAVALAVEFPQAQAQRVPAERTPPADQLIALPFEASDGKQQITIVDPRTRVIAVYQVDKVTGSLALRSVRNVHWDLLMEEYNTSHGSPTPRDIRALAEQR
ncbi:MAG: hypothetical protein ACR2FY_01725 [Pirellulaceae bacterium]